jgi:hypothetical protein
MIRTLFVLAVALAPVAAAQQPPPSDQRRSISPVAIQGNWMGAPGRMPEDCSGDGYLIGFGTGDGKTFIMSVRRRAGGVAPVNSTDTRMEVVPPPANTPTRIDVFLSGPGSDLGIAIRTGSAMELIPAGPDKSYASTSLYLKRCM